MTREEIFNDLKNVKFDDIIEGLRCAFDIPLDYKLKSASAVLFRVDDEQPEDIEEGQALASAIHRADFDLNLSPIEALFDALDSVNALIATNKLVGQKGGLRIDINFENSEGEGRSFGTELDHFKHTIMLARRVQMAKEIRDMLAGVFGINADAPEREDLPRTKTGGISALRRFNSN